MLLTSAFTVPNLARRSPFRLNTPVALVRAQRRARKKPGPGEHEASCRVITNARGLQQWMDQFFVLKKHRRNGIGTAIALNVIASLPGYWEVGQMTNNLPAQAFWKRVIASHTQGKYTEHTLTSGWWQGIVQCFHSGMQR